MIATRSEVGANSGRDSGDAPGNTLGVAPGAPRFRFDASDVTGTHRVSVSDVQRSLPAGAVAKALAARMSLPENVPWSLHDSRGAFLNDDQPIGDQIALDSEVTVAPKTHLG